MTDENEQRNAKRVRRSKWDAVEPINLKSESTSTSAASVAPVIRSPSGPLPIVNTPENIFAQQTALQQSIALRSSLVQTNPLLSGLAGVALGTVPVAPGIQHRVYVG